MTPSTTDPGALVRHLAQGSEALTPQAILRSHLGAAYAAETRGWLNLGRLHASHPVVWVQLTDAGLCEALKTSALGGEP